MDYLFVTKSAIADVIDYTGRKFDEHTRLTTYDKVIIRECQFADIQVGDSLGGALLISRRLCDVDIDGVEARNISTNGDGGFAFLTVRSADIEFLCTTDTKARRCAFMFFECFEQSNLSYTSSILSSADDYFLQLNTTEIFLDMMNVTDSSVENEGFSFILNGTSNLEFTSFANCTINRNHFVSIEGYLNPSLRLSNAVMFDITYSSGSNHPLISIEIPAILSFLWIGRHNAIASFSSDSDVSFEEECSFFDPDHVFQDQHSRFAQCTSLPYTIPDFACITTLAPMNHGLLPYQIALIIIACVVVCAVPFAAYPLIKRCQRRSIELSTQRLQKDLFADFG